MSDKFIRQVELYSDTGGSDKSYFITIEPAGDDLYHVNARYGPRGRAAAPAPQTKTGPVPLAEAEKIFRNLRDKKMNGSSRYRVPEWSDFTAEGINDRADGAGVPGRPPGIAGGPTIVGGAAAEEEPPPEEDFSVNPGMKFKNADPDQLDYYIRDPQFYFEQKADGERAQLVILGASGAIHLLGYRGLPMKNAHALTKAMGIREACAPLVRLAQKKSASQHSRWHFDGEIVKHFWAFDLLQAGRTQYHTERYGVRRDALEAFYEQVWRPQMPSPHAVRLLPAARTAAAKQQMVDRMRAEHCEGLIIKHVDGQYDFGKRVTHSLKLKLKNTMDCFVIERDKGGKLNAVLGVYRADGTQRVIANCSMIGKPDAQPGDVVELSYLYAINKLVQPTLLRIRDDKRAEDCTEDQLHFTKKEVIEF